MSNVNRFMHWLTCLFSVTVGVGSLWLGVALPGHAETQAPRPVAEAARSSTAMPLAPQD